MRTGNTTHEIVMNSVHANLGTLFHTCAVIIGTHPKCRLFQQDVSFSTRPRWRPSPGLRRATVP